MPDRDRAAHHVGAVPVHLAHGPGQPEPLRPRRRAPRLHVGEHLRRERLMDFHHAQLGPDDAGPLQRARHRVHRPHEQLPAGVHRGGGIAPDECERLVAQRGGFLLGHQQHRGGTIGEWGRVAGGDRAVPAVEHGAELGQRLQRGIAPDPVVGGDDLVEVGAAEPGGDLRREPAVVRRGGGTLMAQERIAVLGLAADPVLFRHLFGGLAHRLAGGGLGHGGSDGDEVAGPSAGERTHPCADALRLAGLDQDPAEPPRVEHRDVGERLHSARQNGVGVPERDLVGGVGDGLSCGGAGAVERVRRYAGQELRQQTHLARHVGRAHRRHHLPEDDLVHLAAVELAAHEQLADGMARERGRGDVPEDGPALGEGRTEAGHDGRAAAGPGVGHGVQ